MPKVGAPLRPRAGCAGRKSHNSENDPLKLVGATGKICSTMLVYTYFDGPLTWNFFSCFQNSLQHLLGGWNDLLLADDPERAKQVLNSLDPDSLGITAALSL